MWLPLCLGMEDSAVLARKPELGETATYAVTRRFDDESEKSVLEWKDELTVKVSQRDSLGAFYQTMSWTAVGLTLDGVALEVGKSTPFSYLQRHDKLGAFISRDPDPDDTPLQFRYARSWTLGLPARAVKVGESWDTKFAGEEDVPGIPCVSRLKLVELKDGVASVEVRFWEKKPEAPLKAIGTATLDVASGQVRDLHLDYQNAPIPGGEGAPCAMHLDWVRSDLVAAK